MKDFFDKLLIIFLSSFILFFGVWIYLAPKAEISEKENRMLAQFPKISVQSLKNGSFSKGLGDFYRDRFPLRNEFASIKCKSELICQRKENNGVIAAKNGYLLLRPDYSELDTYLANLSAIEEFSQNRGCDTAVFLAPRGVDVLGSALPYGYPKEQDQELWRIADNQGFEIINANDKIESAWEMGEYVWFKTDHHWTSRGAYIAYKAICEQYDIKALERSSFISEWVDGEFFGTTASRFGAEGVVGDRVEIMRYDGDMGAVVVNYDTNVVESGVYRLEYADTNDKYSVFLGGNHGHIGVYGVGEGRETLVIIKDSFANSVIPFLAYHYDLEIYDLRYFKGNINDEISDISPDKILLLYGIDTLATDNSFKYLNKK